MTNSDTARAEALLGTELCGKWKLERVIGVGGMAAVYKARHRIGTEVAIKMLHPEVASSPQLRARFRREAEVCGTLKHPGAVEVRDVDISETGAPFMVMELLQGESLGERLKRVDDLPLDDALRFMEEALDVLSEAHGRGIIHRDIKLDNLFITDRDQLKVLDFGIASVREAQPMTMVGARLGTLPYMPPEQIRGEQIDARVDLFAMGAVLFRLIAKRRIHDGKTEPELLAKMSTTPAPPLASVAAGTAENVCMLVDRALAFQPDRRYPDAATMRADVQAVRRGEAPPHAARRLAENGPANPPGGTAVLSPRAETSGPMSATAAASPQGVSMTAGPMSATAAASPSGQAGVVSATADATPFAASVGEEPTAVAGPMSAADPIEQTAVSARHPVVPSVAEPTQVSAGSAQLASAKAGVTLVSSTAPSPVQRAAAAMAAAPKKKSGPPLLLLMAAGGALLLLLVVGLYVALSGDETADASGDESADIADGVGESGEAPGRNDGDAVGEIDAPPVAEPKTLEQQPKTQPRTQPLGQPLPGTPAPTTPAPATPAPGTPAPRTVPEAPPKSTRPPATAPTRTPPGPGVEVPSRKSKKKKKSKKKGRGNGLF